MFLNGKQLFKNHKTNNKLFSFASQHVEYSGFLWDTTSGIELKDATSHENAHNPPSNGRHSYPHLYIAHFKVIVPERVFLPLVWFMKCFEILKHGTRFEC